MRTLRLEERHSLLYLPPGQLSPEELRLPTPRTHKKARTSLSGGLGFGFFFVRSHPVVWNLQKYISKREIMRRASRWPRNALFTIGVIVMVSVSDKKSAPASETPNCVIFSSGTWALRQTLLLGDASLAITIRFSNHRQVRCASGDFISRWCKCNAC